MAVLGQSPSARWRSRLALVWLLLCLSNASLTVAQRPEQCSSIPKCQSGACVVRRLPGLPTAVPVCNRCEARYTKINNGRSCGCIPGQYDTGSGCSPCGFGNYCPGARTNYVASPDDNENLRGPQFSCDTAGGTGLNTPTQTARTWNQCVTRPGFRLASRVQGTDITAATQTAVVCEANRYNMGNNRATSCTPCPAGLVTVDSSPNEGVSPRDRDARNDCKIPPGYFYDGSRAALCPRGSYRNGVSDPVRIDCISCGDGISTEAPGATDRSSCTVVEAGFGASWNETGNYAFDATPCPIGRYSPRTKVSGSYNCISCNGYVTKSTQSKSLADCLAPPGYYLNQASSKLELCPTSISYQEYTEGWPDRDLSKASEYGMFGTYRPDWATTPNGVRDCKACGANMGSMRTEPSEMPEGFGSPVPSSSAAMGEQSTNTSTPVIRVATSPSSCYILEGQGLRQDFNLDARISRWRAFNCPDGTVGATDITVGLTTATVCRPVTVYCGVGYEVGAYGDVCVNPAGFGAYAKEALECPDGSWAARGSKAPCEECGEGRTTLTEPKHKQAVTNCFVRPGFGIYNPNGTTSEDKWYSIGSSSAVPQPWAMSLEAQAKLDVAECPVGFYSTSTGGSAGVADVAAMCVSCPPLSSTVEAGSISAQNCTVCQRGSGRSPDKSYGQCEPCNRGFFNTGEQFDPSTGEERGDWQCLQCPRMTFSYPEEADFTTSSTTMQIGSETDSDCVPEFVQLSSFAGTSIFNVSADVKSVMQYYGSVSLEDCVNVCANLANCQLVEFHYASTTAPVCYLFMPDLPTTTGTEVYYKLPPSNDIRAASRVVAASVGTNATTGAIRNISGAAQPNSGRVGAKTIGSGQYAKYVFAAPYNVPWGRIIKTVNTSAVAADDCDAHASCWGFVKAQNGFDLLAGSEVQGVRTIINTNKIADSPSTRSTGIVQPGRYDNIDPCDNNDCSGRGACALGYCYCRSPYYNGDAGRCEREVDDVCAEFWPYFDPYLNALVEPTSISEECLLKVWTMYMGCSNDAYIRVGTLAKTWSSSSYVNASTAMYAISIDANDYFGNPEDQTLANAAAACYGINRYQSVGEVTAGATPSNALDALDPISYIRQCPAGAFISKVTFTRLHFDAWEATCSDGTVLSEKLPEDQSAAVEDIVDLPRGFDESTLVVDKTPGPWYNIIGRYFAVEGVKTKLIGYEYVDNWYWQQNGYSQSVITTATITCEQDEVAVGMYGLRTRRHFASGMHVPTTVGLICQQRALIAKMRGHRG